MPRGARHLVKLKMEIED